MSEQFGADLKIMIVDDQRTMRSIVRKLLGDIGIREIVEAENGDQALKLMSEAGAEAPDLIICDLHMDKMDGLELVNILRRGKGPISKDTPVIILTGDSDKLLQDVSLQVGATKVLTKPISAQDLLTEIRLVTGFGG